MAAFVRTIVFTVGFVIGAYFVSFGMEKIGDGLKGFGTGPLEFQYQIYLMERAAARKDALSGRQGYLDE